MAGNPTIDNLHPIFLNQLLAFVAASGGRVTLQGGSGWRSIADQARLFADFQAGRSSAPSVARPGRSNHNHGLAFDLKFNTRDGAQWAAQNAARFGLHFPVRGENWHVEPIAIDQLRSGAAVSVLPTDLGTTPVSPEQAKERAKELYGYLGWFIDHEEVGPILLQAAQEGWSPDRLQGALTKTKWWKKTSESARQFDALLLMDNATAERRIRETGLSIELEAARLGLKIPDNRVFSMSVEALRQAWNPEELQLAIASELKFRPKAAEQGGVGRLMQNVRELAAQFMVPIDDRQAFGWAQRIAAGVADQGHVEAQFQRLARARFPQLRDEIDSGVTPQQFFDPYRNIIAQELEIAPDDVDLMSERFSPVVNFTDPRTQEQRPMTFGEVERFVRASPEFARTANAREMVSDAAQTVLSVFGKIA